jgi:hypothetical protein
VPWAAPTSCLTSSASVTFHSKSLGGAWELRCMLARLNFMVLQKRLQHEAAKVWELIQIM